MIAPRRAQIIATIAPAIPHLLPLLLGRVYFFGDLFLQFIPWGEFVKGEILSGRLPIWNPYSFCGQPFLANLQSALLYPPGVLFNLLPAGLSAHLSVVAHASWAGLGMFLFGRALGLEPSASLSMSLIYSLGGFFVTKSQFLSMFSSLSWVPWVLLSAHKAGREKGLGPVLRLSLALAMCFLAGHAQIAFLSGLLALVLGALHGLRGLGKVLGGCLSSLLFCAGQFLPTLELVGRSPRAGMPFEEAMRFSLPPWQVLGFISFGAFGHPSWSGYFGVGNYWETCGYAGVLPLALAASAPRGRLYKVALGLSTAGLLLSFGRYVEPLHRALWYLLPPFKVFHDPARFLLLYTVGLALLAALGVEALLRGGKGPSRRATFLLQGIGASSLVALIFSSLLPSLAPSASVKLTKRLLDTALLEYDPALLHDYAKYLVFFPVARSFGLTFLLSFLSLLGLSALLRGKAWPALAILWVDLSFHSLLAYPTVELEKLRATLKGGPRELLSGAKGPLSSRYVVHRPGLRNLLKRQMGYVHYPLSPERALKEVASAMAPNVNVAMGVPCISGYDPLPPREALKVARLAEALLYEQGDERLARALGAGWTIVLDEGGARGKPLPKGTGPFYTVGRAVVAPSFDELRRIVLSPSFDPGREAVLGCSPPFKPRVRADRIRAKWLGDGAEFTVESRGPTLLVTGISAYPGWKAFVDGREISPFVAYRCILSLPIEKGRHTVRLSFRPAPFLVGLYISLLALAGLLGLLFGALRPSRFFNIRSKSARWRSTTGPAT